MENKETSLYAGDIQLSVGGVKFTPKSISIKKSYTTITDTFNFVMPLEDENGQIFDIPNIQGIEVDIYVNKEFYDSGILISKQVNGTDVEYTCSTHGWQLNISEMWEETIFEGKDNLGNTILNILDKNFVDTYEVEVVNEEVASYYFSPTEKEPQKIAYKDEILNNVLESNFKKQEDNYFTQKKSIVILNNNQYIAIEKKKRLVFEIYDPYNLFVEDIGKFLERDEKGVVKQVKADLNEKVFNFIKNITKNTNIFIKCLGKKEKIKDFLISSFIKKLPKSIADTDKETTTYVLFLFRPTQTTNIVYSGKTIQLNDLLDYRNIEKIVLRYLDRNYLPEFGRAEDIYKQNMIYGNVINEGNVESNCLNDLNIDWSSEHDYSIYRIFCKANQTSFTLEETQGLGIDLLKQKQQHFQLDRFDSTTKLGTIKNIIIEEPMGEPLLKRRLNYEINKIKAESYKIQAKVVGYTYDMNFSKVQYNKWNKNNFWSVGMMAKISSPRQNIFDMILMVGDMEFIYDEQNGAYTNLTLIYPLSYSAEELSGMYIDEYKAQEKFEEKLKNNQMSTIDRITKGLTYGTAAVILSPANLIGKALKKLPSYSILGKAIESGSNEFTDEALSIITKGVSIDKFKELEKEVINEQNKNNATQK